MARFDKDRMLDIIRNGSEAEKETLADEIERALDTKRYGLVWEQGGTSADSPFEAEDVVLQMESGIPYPIHREDLSFAGSRSSTRSNLLLEGDNYIWLKILEQTHRGKVGIIYIDPPYNTGHKDFKYNDRFVDINDIFRHSKWIDFMNRRLVAARRLLADTGIMLISCDDNEYAELKMLCDQIFNGNLVNVFHWVSNLKGRQLDGHGAAGTTEYILCYAKSRDGIGEFRGDDVMLRKTMPDVYKASYETFEDERGKFVIKNELYNTNSKFNEETAPTMIYDIYYNPKTGDVLTEDLSDENIHDAEGYAKIVLHPNADGKHRYHVWRWGRRKVENESYNLMFVEKDDGWHAYTKVRDTGFQLKDLIMGISTKSGSDALKALGFPAGTFTAPKPPSLLTLLLGAIGDSDSIVLDFFAGSGTTAQAVEELNAADGGHRQWILVTNNEEQDRKDKGNSAESGICRDITKPRIDAVISGMRPDGTKHSGGADSAYDYYQYDFLERAEQRNQNEVRFRKIRSLAPFVTVKYGARKIATIAEQKALVYDNGEELIILSVGAPTVQDITDIAQAQGIERSRIIAIVPDESPIALDDIDNTVENMMVIPFSKMTDREYLAERK